MADARTVVVFGGTGFLGRRIVRRLAEHGFLARVAARNPQRGRERDGFLRVERVRADVNDARSVDEALHGAFAAVNAVSLYLERGGHTFESVHVEAAARVASRARAASAARLVHISGIGSDPASPSPYIRARGRGEEAVRGAFPNVTIVRPAVMFAADDAFLSALRGLVRLPLFPLFGAGGTRLQPVHADDVAEAAVRLIETPQPAPVYELGGPRVWTYRELLQAVARGTGSRPLLVPVPFWWWRAVGFAAEFLPSPPVTRSQAELMRIDTVASPSWPGLTALGIEPRGIESVLEARG